MPCEDRGTVRCERKLVIFTSARILTASSQLTIANIRTDVFRSQIKDEKKRGKQDEEHRVMKQIGLFTIHLEVQSMIPRTHLLLSLLDSRRPRCFIR